MIQDGYIGSRDSWNGAILKPSVRSPTPDRLSLVYGTENSDGRLSVSTSELPAVTPWSYPISVDHPRMIGSVRYSSMS